MGNGDNMDDPNNFDMAPSLPLMGEVLEDTMFEEINAWDISEGNVEVDQTPLQEQLQKNKECEFISSNHLNIKAKRIKISNFKR